MLLVIYRVRAFLKYLPKNISLILPICNDVSRPILRFRYMLRSNPTHCVGLIGYSPGLNSKAYSALTAFRRQILTSKVDPRTVRVKCV